jgi:catechol 2,3-dioxygenase-like lactoylglutathione lyase family enzyme
VARVVGIDHIVLRVSDFEVSRRFYDRLLSFLGVDRRGRRTPLAG